jgi:hypothetical protein
MDAVLRICGKALGYVEAPGPTAHAQAKRPKFVRIKDFSGEQG